MMSSVDGFGCKHVELELQASRTICRREWSDENELHEHAEQTSLSPHITMCLHNKTTAVIHNGFGHIFSQLKDGMKDGLPVCGNKPAVNPYLCPGAS